MKEPTWKRHIAVTLYDRLTDAMQRRRISDLDGVGAALRRRWFSWAWRQKPPKK